MQQHHLAAKIQSQADAFFRRGVALFDLIETMKEIVDLVFWNAATSIGDGNLNVFGILRILAKLYGNLTALEREF